MEKLDYGRGRTNDLREHAGAGSLSVIAGCGGLSVLVGAITLYVWLQSYVYRHSGENYDKLVLIIVRPAASLVQVLLLGFYLAFMSTPKKIGWIGIVSGVLTGLAIVVITLTWIIDPSK